MGNSRTLFRSSDQARYEISRFKFTIEFGGTTRCLRRFDLRGEGYALSVSGVPEGLSMYA
jgi:hypothetical protein